MGMVTDVGQGHVFGEVGTPLHIRNTSRGLSATAEPRITSLSPFDVHYQSALDDIIRRQFCDFRDPVAKIYFCY